jgi:predicted DNA-binding protein (MmcQ/YjbR family)
MIDAAEPQLAEQLRATYPVVIPGYHLNKRHRNTVIIDDSLPEQMIRDGHRRGLPRGQAKSKLPKGLESRRSGADDVTPPKQTVERKRRIA